MGGDKVLVNKMVLWGSAAVLMSAESCSWANYMRMLNIIKIEGTASENSVVLIRLLIFFLSNIILYLTTFDL